VRLNGDYCCAFVMGMLSLYVVQTSLHWFSLATP
jgi:hypothetical protein